MASHLKGRHRFENDLPLSSMFGTRRPRVIEERVRIRKREDPERSVKTRLSDFGVDYLDEYNFDEDDSDTYPRVDLSEDHSQLAYKAACKTEGVVVNKHVLESLLTNVLAVRNQSLTPPDIKTCMVALLRNSSIDTLILDANGLAYKSLDRITQTLANKLEIVDLAITNNALGRIGVRSLCQVLSASSTIKKIDLSGNHLTETDAPYLRELLEENGALKVLNISHNELRERGGEIVAEGLAKNDTLRVLNISWNHLRMSGATAIGESLQVNNTLEEINLGWNGFNVRGCVALGKALEVNTSLQQLDLSCNRMTELSVSQILRGLINNSTLRELKLPLNGISPTGCLTLLKVLEKYQTIKVQFLDFGTQSVTEDFVDLKTKLMGERPLKIIHGPVLRRELKFSSIQEDLDEVVEKSIQQLMEENPMMVLFEFAKQQNLRLLDMFNTIDRDKSGTLTKQELAGALTTVNIPIPVVALERLIQRMDVNNDNVVDYGELAAGHKAYKDSVKESLKAGTFSDSEIGRISSKIKDLMTKQESSGDDISPRKHIKSLRK